MLFILLIRNLYQLQAWPSCRSGLHLWGWPVWALPTWQLAGTSARQTGLPPLRGPGAFHKTWAGLWHQALLLKCACTLWNFKSLLSGSDTWAPSCGLFSFSCLSEPEEPPPPPTPHTPSAKPVPCSRCLCCTSLMLDLCPLQGAKPGLLARSKGIARGLEWQLSLPLPGACCLCAEATSPLWICPGLGTTQTHWCGSWLLNTFSTEKHLLEE